MFAGVMTGLEELRLDMTKRMDRVDEMAQNGHESLRDELIDVKSQARGDQAQLIRDTDHCLAESLALAAKESQERDVEMTREIERLLNDHDFIYAHTMTSLEKLLDAKADLMKRNLDEILSSGNRENRHAPTQDSRHTTDGGGGHGHARAQPRSRTSFESNHGERPRAAPSRAGRTNPAPPEAEATSGAQYSAMPQVRSVPDLTTISHDITMHASRFEPLNRSLEKLLTKLSMSTERGERSRKTLKKPKLYKDESDGCIDTWIEQFGHKDQTTEKKHWDQTSQKISGMKGSIYF